MDFNDKMKFYLMIINNRYYRIKSIFGHEIFAFSVSVFKNHFPCMLQRKKTGALIFIKEAWEVWDECEPTIWKFPNKAAQRKIRKVANEEPPPNIVQLLPHWVKLCFKRDNRSNMHWALYWRWNFLPTNRALSIYKYFW